MLVLTRRIDEAIAIGDAIVVTVLAIEGDRVKIGIAAPREIPILRHEVFLSAASGGGAPDENSAEDGAN